MSALDDVRARHERAGNELDRLTSGSPGALWRWSIPANPEKDSDLLLSDSIADTPKLLGALDAVLGILDAADHRTEEIGRPRRGVLLHTKDLRAAITEALG